jgi:LysM repeat protein
MKRMHTFFVLFFSMILLSVTGFAQDDYMVHTIKKGETLSAIAKQYHSTVGDIMRLNGMNGKSKLKIGQKIKISSAVAVSPKVQKKETKETAVVEEPVTVVTTPSANAKTHIVGNKETLYGISKKYKVSVADIQKWNNLKNTNIRGGQKLIVGYAASSEVAVAPAVVETKPAAPVVTTPVASTTPATTAITTTPAKKEDKPNTPPAATTANTSAPDNGFFASYFQKSGKEVSGDAATFKTASGWLDKKFYVLMNNVTEGTVVKVTSNNKVVYARVLGPLPDIKEDSGLLVRISNAAASSLGINDTKFPVTVNY